ncbi:MAG TPA: hypothetical protein VNP92_16800, partial [Actinophytocola sp.]|nr:hypothetical protein [Actinophytocola sp.]
MRVAVLGLLLLPGLLLTAQAAAAQPEQQPKPANPQVKCRMADPRLAELSGLVAAGNQWYAVNDGGDRVSVFVLTKDCKVQREIVGQTDPFDVEDLGRQPDGTFLLGDTGDNELERDTAAVIALTPEGKSTLYRMTYPDGRHDAEALLIDAVGQPYVVTKSNVGNAGVYTPVRKLVSPGPTPMKKVADIKIAATDTKGGPVPGIIGSRTITGGAVSADGTVIALRTYTDAYVYGAPDKDLVKALGTKPVRVPLPNEAQGEAITFEADGSLVSASEKTGQPIRTIAEAAKLVEPQEPPPAVESVAPPPGPAATSGRLGDKEGLPVLPAALI